jgi:transcriptional regulator with XRE-family HTH domain
MSVSLKKFQTMSRQTKLYRPARIKALMVIHDLTQAEMARLTGITQERISKLSRGVAPTITADQLHKLCTTLDVSADWLLGLK